MQLFDWSCNGYFRRNQFWIIIKTIHVDYFSCANINIGKYITVIGFLLIHAPNKFFYSKHQMSKMHWHLNKCSKPLQQYWSLPFKQAIYWYQLATKIGKIINHSGNARNVFCRQSTMKTNTLFSQSLTYSLTFYWIILFLYWSNQNENNKDLNSCSRTWVKIRKRFLVQEKSIKKKFLSFPCKSM